MSTAQEDAAAAAADRAWELEMEMAIESRGRTRSRSILADSTSEDQDDTSRRSTSRRRYHDDDQDEQSEQMYQLDALDREIDIIDNGHDPSWSRSNSGGSSTDMRSRARSFSARKLAEMESEAQHLDDSGRRRSCSFSSLNRGAGRDDDDDDEDGDDDVDQIVKRAASLSKIYLVGSAPVDVSKLQDDSKIVGVKKVEVVQPTGALSAKALDALSEGLQLSVDNSLMLGGGGLLAKENEKQLTEEQLEEKKMEEEEDHKLKAEKMSTRKTLSARASMFKAKVFKSKPKASSPIDGSRTGAPTSGDASSSASFSGTDKAPSESTVDVPVVPKKRHKLKLLLLGDSGTSSSVASRWHGFFDVDALWCMVLWQQGSAKPV